MDYKGALRCGVILREKSCRDVVDGRFQPWRALHFIKSRIALRRLDLED